MPTSAPISRRRTATPRRSSGRPQALQKTLVAEMRGRIKEDDSGVPQPDGPFAYLWKYRQGGQHELIGRTPRDGGDARIILDGDALAKASDVLQFRRHAAIRPTIASKPGAPTCAARSTSPSACEAGRRGEDLPDIVEQTGGSVVWGRDSTFFLYVRLDENHRPLQVFRHRLGTRAERRRAGLRGEGQRLVHAHRGKRERPLLHRRHRQPGDLRALADRPVASRRHAAPGGGARDRRALQRLRSRRRALHPHQRRRRDRLPHRHRAAGDAGPQHTGAS